jgi:hypothetical protein
MALQAVQGILEGIRSSAQQLDVLSAGFVDSLNEFWHSTFESGCWIF